MQYKTPQLPLPLYIEAQGIVKMTSTVHMLQTADREINLFRAKAQKRREQKKGFMQHY